MGSMAGERERPRKPYDPAAVAIFGAAGERPRFETEMLPEDDRLAEALVAERFATGLVRSGRTARVLERVGEFPDARLEVDGVEVGLELVEVVNSRLRARNVKRRWYGAALRDALAAVSPALTGVTLLIDDGAAEDLWPREGTTSARGVVRDLAQAVFANAGQLAELPPHRQGLIDAPPGALAAAPDAPVTITCYHREDDDPMVVRVMERGHERADERASVLETAVAAKVNAGYRYGSPLWLLAWTTRGYVTGVLARWRAWDMAESTGHPFDSVWGLELSVGNDVLPIEIWPSRPDEARPPDPDPKERVLSLEILDGMMGPPGPKGASMKFPPHFPG